jgi:hypothetical protein
VEEADWGSCEQKVEHSVKLVFAVTIVDGSDVGFITGSVYMCHITLSQSNRVLIL